jgi:hypothetical protein
MLVREDTNQGGELVNRGIVESIRLDDSPIGQFNLTSNELVVPFAALLESGSQVQISPVGTKVW